MGEAVLHFVAMGTQLATPGGRPIALVPRVSVVIPCLNEADNIVQCVNAAIEFLQPGGSTSSRAAATAVELPFAL